MAKRKGLKNGETRTPEEHRLIVEELARQRTEQSAIASNSTTQKSKQKRLQRKAARVRRGSSNKKQRTYDLRRFTSE